MIGKNVVGFGRLLLWLRPRFRLRTLESIFGIGLNGECAYVYVYRCLKLNTCEIAQELDIYAFRTGEYINLYHYGS